MHPPRERHRSPREDREPAPRPAPGEGREPAARELLRRLCTAPGPPGAEGPVRRIVRETLEGLGRISHDRLGSILCERTGSSASPRIVLDAHMDEVGFLVQSILEDGRLNFVPLGGWWGHVLLAQRVDILTALDGPAEEPRLIPGVIGSKPPHFLRPAEREKVLELDSMYIDVGTSSRVETEALGIRPGDPVVPHAEFLPLAAEGLLSAKAFDDRAGVGVLCEAFLALGSETHPNTVVGVGAVQEEVGSRGAGTASELARPDLAIVLEGAPADDLPGFTERQAVLGKGPQVRFFDPTAISNRRLVGFVERMAAEKGIPIQIAVRRSGGTDAKSIHLHGPGVPTVVISVPARYIHTHVSIIHWRDYLAARDLVVALCLRLDARTVAELTRFDESPAPEPERDRSPHGRGL